MKLSIIRNNIFMLSGVLLLIISSSAYARCDNPITVSGVSDPTYAGFIVDIEPSVEFKSELRSLVSRYQIRVLLSDEVNMQFYGLMSDLSMEKLRCEGSVKSISYNEIHIPARMPTPAPPMPPPAPTPSPPPERMK